MAIQKEIWTGYIVEQLFADNQFLEHAANEDDYVMAGKVVHIPQAGAVPTVAKNPSSYPLVAVQRTDTDVTYVLDEYSTAPTHIKNADTIELSYDKITSVLGNHSAALNDTIANDILIKWATGLGASNIVKTTGAATASKVAGQTGNRKVFTQADLKAVQTKMNLQNIPKNDRYILLESNMLDELTSDLSATQNRDFSQYFDAANGIVGRLFGFNIMERSNVLIASSADAVNPLGASVLATDNVVSLAWQKNQVARALGSTDFFENLNDALYQGDVYSALLRMGGRKKRADNKGIISIIQGV